MNFNFKGMLRGLLGRSVAGPDTDPQLFYGAQLAKALAMPNPDPLLRQMGQAEKVYYSIAAEPHVLGDIRSIRGNFRSHEYRLLAGDEGDSKSLAAQKLCERWMASTQPNAICDWLDVLWQMSSAFLTTGAAKVLAPREAQVGDRLPYAGHLDDVTLQTREGFLVQTLHLAGFPFETAADEDFPVRLKAKREHGGVRAGGEGIVASAVGIEPGDAHRGSAGN